MDIYKWYMVARMCYLRRIPLVPQIIKAAIRVLWGGVIPYQAQIGKGTILEYQALGLVIHKRAVIGECCHIGQGVTIGGTSGKEGVPVIGDRVFIGCNAVVLGDITIGDEVTVGAGAVVTKSIPANCVVAGIPAKIVKKNAPAYPGLANE